MSKRLATGLIIVLVLILLSTGLALAYYIIGSTGESTPRTASQAPSTLDTSAISTDQIQTSLPSPIAEVATETSPSTTTPTSMVLPTLQLAATHTSEPQVTNSPTPSATLPPTKTPDADVCSRVNIQFRQSTSNIALWQLNNMNFQPSGITRIALTWPKQNQAVFNAFLEGKVIWAGGNLTSPTIVTDWMGSPSDRQVLGSTRLEFLFGTDAASSGYEITVELDNGCSVTTSN
jgi:hypothetical protein